MSRKEERGVGTFRCLCTTPDTPELTMRPCLSGSLIAYSENMGSPSQEMLLRRENLLWVPSSGLLIKIFNYQLLQMEKNHVIGLYASCSVGCGSYMVGFCSCFFFFVSYHRACFYVFVRWGLCFLI